jgi:hypothetical protein
MRIDEELREALQGRPEFPKGFAQSSASRVGGHPIHELPNHFSAGPCRLSVFAFHIDDIRAALNAKMCGG